MFGDDEAQRFRGTLGEAGRLIAYPDKTEVTCPVPGPATAVVLAIGQSNIANQAENRMASHHRGEVVNFFDGKCYPAESPPPNARWSTTGASFSAPTPMHW